MLYHEGAKTQRTLSLEGVTLKDTNLPFESVSTSLTHQDPDEAGQAYFCVTISGREKVELQPIISYMMYLIMVDMSFS